MLQESCNGDCSGFVKVSVLVILMTMVMIMMFVFATHLTFGVPWSAVCVGEGGVEWTLGGPKQSELKYIVVNIIRVGGFTGIDKVLEFTLDLDDRGINFHLWANFHSAICA